MNENLGNLLKIKNNKFKSELVKREINSITTSSSDEGHIQ